VSEAPQKPQSGHSLWPVFLVCLALFATGVDTSLRIRSDREALDARFAQQEQQLADAKKLREQLQSIASDTARLAESGNPNAIRLRDYLAQQGITIRSPSSAAQDP
jgi:hypothetical protein